MIGGSDRVVCGRAPAGRRSGDQALIPYGLVIDAVQDLLAPQAARDLLLSRLRALPAERVPLAAELAGRVLAEPVRAVRDLPPFPNSAMDGYALRAADAG